MRKKAEALWSSLETDSVVANTGLGDEQLVDRDRDRVCVNARAGAGVTLSAERLPRRDRFFAIQFDRRFGANPSIFAIARQKGIVATLERNVKRRACFRERIPSSRSPWKNICFLRRQCASAGTDDF